MCITVQIFVVHMLLHYCAKRGNSYVSTTKIHMLQNNNCAKRDNLYVAALLCKSREFICCYVTVQAEVVDMFLHYCVKSKFTCFCTTVQTERVHMFLRYCANRSLHVSVLLSKLKFTCYCTTVQIEVYMFLHY